ncbi:MAG: hypothetical protein DRP02_12580 [Candidatus Gerdarchaeota archaeon]|nr:MAG: hypothetical protein DRP02_12580 [Candidatus Gerdarchaeota archaeon]
MTDHVGFALFVYTRDTEYLIERLQDNPFGIKITSLAFDSLMQDPERSLEGVDHLVVSGTLNVIKEVLGFAMKYNFSVGLIPMNTQKDLAISESLNYQKAWKVVLLLGLADIHIARNLTGI